MHPDSEQNPIPNRPAIKGRGTALRPNNRFERVYTEDDFEQLDPAADDAPVSGVVTEYLPDDSQSIVSTNDSPDIPFRFSLNPYRGCAHGCSYCYARPYHEYLGLNAGIDFESKVLVKYRAPELLRAWLARDAWEPEAITFSGVTDCYQPAEREFRLTRGCLEVACEAGQPIAIITKNALVTRDLDILRQMAADRTASVALSITTLDAELARTMEPRTSSPAARLRAVRQLADAGIPVRVMVAPIIPGLNDFEIPAVLKAASEAGAQGAGYTVLRLPLAVLPIFVDWLARTQPLKAEKIQSFIRATRGGKLNDSKFGSRMRGEGLMAEQIRQTFRVFAKRYGLDGKKAPLETRNFRPPRPLSGQMRLF
jgi:DNA repair photolyase